ncbi:MAG: hypothetical protein A3E01_08425 [Gammaproteobacteria bacterium RIFCSPHIGHO2_12_FULL_63_22]|nr:MAG: hypothetical protein A3E01_08425 [Gammaproteobacteria bacterium RIFCSPHIGHO2_12_FULL_63_22]
MSARIADFHFETEMTKQLFQRAQSWVMGMTLSDLLERSIWNSCRTSDRWPSALRLVQASPDLGDDILRAQSFLSHVRLRYYATNG